MWNTEKDQAQHLKWLQENRQFLTKGDVFCVGDVYSDKQNIWGVVISATETNFTFSKLWDGKYHPSAPVNTLEQNGLYKAIGKMNLPEGV